MDFGYIWNFAQKSKNNDKPATTTLMITDEEIEQAFFHEFGVTLGPSHKVALFMARWMEKRVFLQMAKDAIKSKTDNVINSIDNMIGLMQNQ